MSREALEPNAEKVPVFTFDKHGHLSLDFGLWNDGWREAICPKCHTPIRWVLDMASFTSVEPHGHLLAHARCVWLPEAFLRQVDRPALEAKLREALYAANIGLGKDDARQVAVFALDAIFGPPHGEGEK